MLDYILLFLAVPCVGLQLTLTKIFQSKVGKDLSSSLLFNTILGVVSCALFLCFTGFCPHLNRYSVVMAMLLAGTLTFTNLLSIKAISLGKVAIYSLFLMLGGMLLPFLYGAIFLSETIGIWRYIALVLLICALCFPLWEKNSETKKNSKSFIFFCVLLFFANGCVSVVSKMHQISPLASGTNDFLFIVYVFLFVFNIILLSGMTVYKKWKKSKNTNFLLVNPTRLPNGDQSENLMLDIDGQERVDAERLDINGQGCNLVKTIKRRADSGKSRLLGWAFLIGSGVAIITSIGFLLQLLGAKNLPASVLYPIVTGGTIMVTSLFGRLFFKEKISLHMVIGLGIAFVATVLFLF